MESHLRIQTSNREDELIIHEISHGDYSVNQK
jgi:hypothetical protein